MLVVTKYTEAVILEAMKNLAITNDLKKHKYVYSFFLPFSILGILSGIVYFVQLYRGEIPRPNAIEASLTAGFLYGLFFGFMAGFSGLLIVVISQKLKWVKNVKSSIFLTSIVVCFIVFALGFFLDLIPNTRRHKFIMPGTNQVYF